MKIQKWVDEIPSTVRTARGNEYDAIIAELKSNPGKVALVGKYQVGVATVKGIVPLKNRGANVSRRTIDGFVHVYAEWPVKRPRGK